MHKSEHLTEHAHMSDSVTNNIHGEVPRTLRTHRALEPVAHTHEAFSVLQQPSPRTFSHSAWPIQYTAILCCIERRVASSPPSRSVANLRAVAAASSSPRLGASASCAKPPRDLVLEHCAPLLVPHISCRDALKQSSCGFGGCANQRAASRRRSRS